jgi:phospholipid/cholesterol/gamma-HCH transport system ATP-binding protein
VADHIVDATELRKRFGATEVLRGVSFALDKRETLVIMGGSGSGKTVLLRTIAGLIRPDAGGIEVFGIPIARLSEEELLPVRRRMGYVFQGAALFDSLSVHENVAFPLREHTALPEAAIRDLVLMKLHAVGLRGARALRVSDLSGGMTRRVALARAIATDPTLAMYDEPFAGLDPISLNVIATLIRKLNDALGLTSIVVTYDVKEALAVSDYVYVIGDGVVLGQGTSAEVASSEDPYLKQFLNALPDGPVRFHFPGPELAEDLNLAAVPGDKA